MRYATSYVKKLKVAKKDNGPHFEASVETVLYSDTAQNIAEKIGYVPLPQTERLTRKASLATTE
jgi:ABC-type phosphate transport system substrate-binding protein